MGHFPMAMLNNQRVLPKWSFPKIGDPQVTIGFITKMV